MPFTSGAVSAKCVALRSAVCPCSRDSGLLELMSQRRSALATACHTSGHLSTTSSSSFIVLLTCLNPHKGHFTWGLNIMSSPQGTTVYWLYWIMWHNIDLCRCTCFLGVFRAVLMILSVSSNTWPSFLSLSREWMSLVVFSTRYNIDMWSVKLCFFLLQTLAGSWLSPTQWSGVENSSSPTTWTLIMLLLSGKQTNKQTLTYLRKHQYIGSFVRLDTSCTLSGQYRFPSGFSHTPCPSPEVQ